MKTPKNEVEQIGDVLVIGVGGIGLKQLAEALRPVIRDEIRAQQNDTMLSGAEAAKLLGVSRVTIYNMVQAGKLNDHGTGKGRATKISRREVLAISRHRNINKKHNAKK